VTSKLSCAAATLAALAFAAAPAQAAQTRVLLRTFGALSTPQGEAIDQETGDVYVADVGTNRIQAFTGEGTFLLMFGKEVDKTKVILKGTPAEQDVCTALSGDECQAGAPGSSPGAFTTAAFVAVDNDPSSSSFHDVYVGDTGDGIVSKFTPEGNLVESWGTNGQLDGSTTPATSFATIAGVAVNAATGTLYVISHSAGFACFQKPCTAFEFEPGGEFIGEFSLGSGGTGSEGGAVDDAGNLFKSAESAIARFNAGGVETAAAINSESSHAFTIDPATGDLYAAGASGTIAHYQFNSEGNVIEPGGAPPCVPSNGCGATDTVPVGFAASGIAFASASGDTYLSNGAEGKIDQFGPLVTVPDAKTQPATEEKPTSARLNGAVNPDGLPVSECVFEYGETTSYGKTSACETEPSGPIGNGTSEVPVHADIKGLTPGVIYHFRLIARNANDPSPQVVPDPGLDASFETLPPPSIDSATVSSLTKRSVVLNAKIKPQFSKTLYHFEYDTRRYAVGEGPHGTSVPASEKAEEEKALPAGQSDVSVSAPIEELEEKENTLYYWRVVATNESGTTTSVQHMFIYETAASGLPDGRAYEMVSPTHKNGALLGDAFIFGLPPEIAANGERVITPTIQCFANSESCQSDLADSVGTPYEFTRTPGGWVTTALSPPAPRYPHAVFWWGYDANTGAAMFGTPTPPDEQHDFYVRQPGGGIADLGPNTPPEEGAKGPSGGRRSDEKQAATADFSHFAWASTLPWPFEPNIGSQTVFEYAPLEQPLNETRPLLVGVTGLEGSNSLISNCGTNIGAAALISLRGTMSADGRTVFFTAKGGGGCEGTNENAGTEVPADEVFARVDGEFAQATGAHGEAHTVHISEPTPSQCGAGGAPDEVACRAAKPANAGFIGASEDGSKAFFLSTQQLTDQASEDSDESDNAAEDAGCTVTAGPNGCNLYEYENLTATEPAKEGRLIDLSAGDTSGKGGGGPSVQGVVAISPDGSHVYFVAKGVLTTVPNDREQIAQNGANNLYAYADGKVSFITDLPSSDRAEWQETPGSPANVTPDGRYLVFLSQGDLTADDTSVSGAKQVFRYDAQSGRLIRLSIGSNGFNDDGNRSAPVTCNVNSVCTEDAHIVEAGSRERSDSTMSDDGTRVFIESPVGLTTRALDDVQIEQAAAGPIYAENVYEWEQEGAGSCPQGRAAGCVFLISDGQDAHVNKGATTACGASADVGETPSAVCLLGSDSEGKNVFFTTANPLAHADTNTEVDYYDARVCEPESPCISEPPPPLPPCQGEACHGIPPARSPFTPGPTATFNGAGNIAPPAITRSLTNAQKLAKALKACRTKYKHSKKRRAACEKSARQKYGPAKKSSAKRAVTNRRRGR